MSDNYIDPEIKVIELWDGSLWVERPGWTCTFDGVEGDGERNVCLGAFFQVQDMIDAGAFDDDTGRPWVVISQIYPIPEELSPRFKAAVILRK